MPIILVVDDSSVDRRLAGGLLDKDASLRIEYAIHGADALTKIEQQQPDLIVTDLIMPEMDGLELVAYVRERYPLVPVVLITSKGNEELAVEALQKGASSYVPKRLLARDLLETVRKVLAVSSRDRSHSRLIACLVSMNFKFILKNDAELIGPLVAHLQDCVGQMGICGLSERTRLGVALEEALVNAVYHGNLEVSSDLREEDLLAFYRVAEQRRQESPYKDRVISLEAQLSREKASFTIRDEGPGFNPSAIPNPTDPANLEKLSGRGILLMQTFMDEVAYNDIGNVVTLTKHSAEYCTP